MPQVAKELVDRLTEELTDAVRDARKTRLAETEKAEVHLERRFGTGDAAGEPANWEAVSAIINGRMSLQQAAEERSYYLQIRTRITKLFRDAHGNAEAF